MPPTPENSRRWTGTLPLRVTGIVFWGLIVIGMLVVSIMLNGRENHIVQRQQAVVDRFMSELHQDPTWSQLEKLDELSALAYRISASSGAIQSVAVATEGQTLLSGEKQPDQIAYTRRVWLNDGVESTNRTPVSITLSLVAIEKQVAQERKGLLLGMGGLFVLFGVALQWVLDRVLTRPFQQMVATACSFSRGDEKTRFDDVRPDEFGYLGRFINQALDYSNEQKDALRQALEHARNTEHELYKEKEKALVTLHSIGDAVITTDRSGCVSYMNPVAEELLGLDFERIRNTPLGKMMRLIDESSGKSLSNPVDQCLESGEKIVQNGHKLLVCHDGRKVAISDTAAPILDEHGEIEGVVMVFHDVGQAYRLARQLSHQARHDPLTGLFNRREFESQLGKLIETAQTDGLNHALCYIDLDQFKVVNDVCGHKAGDELLRQLAELFQSQVREADILARLGGDEFGVLLTRCSTAQAVRIAENIRSAAREFRFLYQDRSFEVGASIGVVSISPESRSASELLSAADLACYAAKDGGRNRVHLYRPSDEELAERRGEMDWVSEIIDAIETDRLYLLFQPVIALGSRAERRPDHYELLLRMRDRTGNEVLPMAFLPAAERYNLMTEIDSWVVKAVMQRVASCDSLPDDGIFLINVSGTSLSDPEFVIFLEEQLESMALPPSRLCFEITEASAISNLRAIVNSVQRLRKLGCKIALDDFGSGLSAFGHLKNLRVDYIKIDGGLVRDMAHDRLNAAMVQAINEISHVVGVQTIAEFVETPEVLESLTHMGIDYGQGHCIAPPRPIDDLFGGRDQPGLKLVKF